MMLLPGQGVPGPGGTWSWGKGMPGLRGKGMSGPRGVVPGPGYPSMH